MAITANQMKANLQQARRGSPIPLSEGDIEAIKQMVKEGVSKKILCTLCGIDYQQLKQLIK
ncbi:hypothetical protein RCJ22_15645 [Vibrio sp. FNV 38]|nr:hypothetical protein [Vibrio sp. FNV 38]